MRRVLKDPSRCITPTKNPSLGGWGVIQINLFEKYCKTPLFLEDWDFFYITPPLAEFFYGV